MARRTASQEPGIPDNPSCIEARWLSSGSSNRQAPRWMSASAFSWSSSRPLLITVILSLRRVQEFQDAGQVGAQ